MSKTTAMSPEADWADQAREAQRIEADRAEALAVADTTLASTGLPTYSELRHALGALYASMAHGPHARSFEVAKHLDQAAAVLARTKT